ncbi:hypothetical protein ACH0AH_00670 [Microbacterium paludicola]|uniref:hypothetical protein n=1 Tax=Microbacterium paludicola TaxID=300019 RepID=UPI0038791DA1
MAEAERGGGVMHAHFTESENAALRENPLSGASTLADAADVWLQAQKTLVTDARFTALRHQLDVLAERPTRVPLTALTPPALVNLLDEIWCCVPGAAQARVFGKTLRLVLDFAERTGLIPALVLPEWLSSLEAAPFSPFGESSHRPLNAERTVLAAAGQRAGEDISPLTVDSRLDAAVDIWLRCHEAAVSRAVFEARTELCADLAAASEFLLLSDLTADCVRALLDDCLMAHGRYAAHAMGEVLIKVLRFATRLGAPPPAQVPVRSSRREAAG